MKRSSCATASDICARHAAARGAAKCTMCHEHYKQAKPNQPIGALSYQLRVE